MIMALLCIVIQLCMLVLSPVTAQAKASCQGSGDVHYTTFDGHRAIDVQGTCMHTVARTCCANSCPLGATPQPGKPCTGAVLDEFHVMAQHIKTSPKTAIPTSGVSYVDYVVVELCGYTVVMKTVGIAAKYSIVCPRVTAGMTFNHKSENQDPVPATKFPCRFGMASPAFKIATCGATCIELTTTYGVVVRYDTHLVKVTVPSKYQNVMCGICGDYNGKLMNDFRTKDGADVSKHCDPQLSSGSVGDYLIGNSWIVNNCYTANCVPRTSRRKRSISTRALTPSDVTCNGWIDDICALCPSSLRAPILAMCLNYMRFVEAQCTYCKTRSCSCDAFEAEVKGAIQGKVKTDCGTCDCGNCRALVARSRGCLSADAKNRAVRECLVDCKILQGEAARDSAVCRGRRQDWQVAPNSTCPPPFDWMKANEEAVMSVMRANSGNECRANPDSPTP